MYTVNVDGQKVWSSDNIDESMGIISPELDLEINRAGSFEFTLIKNHPMYDSFQVQKSIVTIFDDTELIYRGRVAKITTDFYLQKQIECEGDLCFLADSVLDPINVTVEEETPTDEVSEDGEEPVVKGVRQTAVSHRVTMTVAARFRDLISQHNSKVDSWKHFTVGTVSVKAANETKSFEETAYKDTLSTIQDELISKYGGILRTRLVNGTPYIDYIEAYGENTSQPIEYASNLLDMEFESNSDDLWTVLIPVGNNNITVAEVNGGSKYIESPTLVSKYGKIYKAESFSGCDTAAELKSEADKFIQETLESMVDSFTVKAIDLHLMDNTKDKLLLGRKVHLVSPPHGIDKTLTIIKAEIYLAEPQNDSYEIGEPDNKKDHSKDLSSQTSSALGASGANSGSVTSIQYELNRYGDEIIDQAYKISLIASDEELDAFSRLVLDGNKTILESQTRWMTATESNLNIAGLYITRDSGELEIRAIGQELTTAEDTVYGQKKMFDIAVTSLGLDLNQIDKELKLYMTEDQYTNWNKANSSYDAETKTTALTFEGYTKIVNPSGYNPRAEGWYEKISDTRYRLTTDSTPVAGKDYYKRSQHASLFTAVDRALGIKVQVDENGDPVTDENGLYVFEKDGDLYQRLKYAGIDIDGDLNEVTILTETGAIGAAIKSKADELSSEIELKAYTEDVNAAITSTATELGGRIDLKVDANGVIAAINLSAEKDGESVARISANKINLDGYVTANAISAERAALSSLITGVETGYTVKVKNLYFQDNGSPALYQKCQWVNIGFNSSYTTKLISSAAEIVSASGNNISLAHSHSIKASADTNGKVTIKLGAAQAAEGSDSFNIADTAFYKGRIGVKSVQSLVSDPNVDISYNATNNTLTVPVRATPNAGNNFDTSISFDASKARSAGYTAGYNGAYALLNVSATNNLPYVATVSASKSTTSGANFAYLYLTPSGWSDNKNTIYLVDNPNNITKIYAQLTVTAPAAPAATHSISISRGTRATSGPSPATAVQIWTGSSGAATSVTSNGFYSFTVSCGGTTKDYYFYVNV